MLRELDEKVCRIIARYAYAKGFPKLPLEDLASDACRLEAAHWAVTGGKRPDATEIVFFLPKDLQACDRLEDCLRRLCIFTSRLVGLFYIFAS